MGTEVIEASTQNNPELANELTQQMLSATTTPTDLGIKTPPSPAIELPGGFMDHMGHVHHSALVRELTGRDEELLSRLDAVKSPSSLIRTITKCGTVEIGSEPINEMTLSMLLVGDRNMLVLAIRQVTFGNEMPMDIVCPSCGAAESITVELDVDVPIKKLEDPQKRIWPVELSCGEAKVMLTTAEIEDKILDMAKATPAERNTYMLQRCVLELNGVQPSREDLLNLSVSDRRKLVDVLVDEQPGPQYAEVKLPCGSCGREFPLSLTLGDLFRY